VLTTRYHDTNGTILHSFAVDKRGAPAAGGTGGGESLRTLSSGSTSTSAIVGTLCVCAIGAIVGLYVVHAKMHAV
jgi:hypothetical protein